MKAGRKAARSRGRHWAGWAGIILGVGLLAGGFVTLRNAQVRAGEELRKAEERLADLESEIELYEARLAGLTSRPQLSAALQAHKPDLRRLKMGEAILLARPVPAGQAPGEGEN